MCVRRKKKTIQGVLASSAPNIVDAVDIVATYEDRPNFLHNAIGFIDPIVISQRVRRRRRRRRKSVHSVYANDVVGKTSECRVGASFSTLSDREQSSRIRKRLENKLSVLVMNDSARTVTDW